VDAPHLGPRPQIRLSSLAGTGTSRISAADEGSIKAVRRIATDSLKPAIARHLWNDPNSTEVLPRKFDYAVLPVTCTPNVSGRPKSFGHADARTAGQLPGYCTKVCPVSLDVSSRAAAAVFSGKGGGNRFPGPSRDPHCGVGLIVPFSSNTVVEPELARVASPPVP